MTKPSFGVGVDRWFVENGYDKPCGTVHVGVNDGCELGWYLQEGQVPILGFEPENSSFKSATESFNVEIGVGLIKLYRTLKIPERKTTGEWATQGSSFLNELHLGDEYHVRTHCFMRLHRFDELVQKEKWDMSLYNLLVIDVQGMELQVLKGFGDYLNGFKYLVVECSDPPIYESEAPAQEVIDFLRGKEFKQMTPTLSHNDILFLKQ